jgi:hypothetical protein
MTCPVPHRNFRQSPMTKAEAAAVTEWYEHEIRTRAEASRDPRPCAVPGCDRPGRLYMAGQRCDQHKPQPILEATP